MKKLITLVLLLWIGFQNICFSQIAEIEPNNYFNQSMNFTLNSTISEKINPAGDVDFFKIISSQGGSLIVDINNIPNQGFYGMHIEFYIYASDTTNLIAHYTHCCNDPYYPNDVSYAALVCSGTYYVKIKTDNNGSSNIAFNTTISLDTTEVCECNNYFATACTATLGVTFPEKIYGVNLNDSLYGGNIGADVDFYKVIAPQGGSLIVDINNIPSLGFYGMHIEFFIYSADTTNIIAHYSYGSPPYYPNDISYAALICPGTYYVKIKTDNNGSSNIAFNTTISLDTTEVCECNNYFATACTATLGVTFPEKIYGVNLNDSLYGGNIGADVDFYKVIAPQGGSLIVDINNIPSLGFYGMHIEFFIYSADTTNIIAHYSYGSPPYYPNDISYAALICPGTYYVKIKTDNNESSNIAFNTYISLDTTEVCECNNYFATACNATLGVTFPEKIYGVNLNDTLYGGINGTDVDFYKVSVPQGGSLVVDINNIPNQGFYGMPIEFFIYKSDTTSLVAHYFHCCDPYYPSSINYPIDICSGIYYIKIKTDNYSTNSTNFYTTFSFVPNIISLSVLPNDTVCVGTPVTLTATGGITYSWSGGVTNGTPFTPSATGTYTVTVTSASGCNETSTQLITLNPLPIVTAANVVACEGTSIQLVSYPIGGTYSITNPYSGPSTTYTYTYTDSNGCTATSSTAAITSNPLPIVSLSATPPSICLGSSSTLIASGANTYTINPGGFASPLIVSPISNTTYTLSGTDSNGCINTTTTTVTIKPLPNITTTAFPSTGVCIGDSVKLTASGGTSYQWSGGVINGTYFTPAATTVYTVMATGSNSCTNTASRTIYSGTCAECRSNIIISISPYSILLTESQTYIKTNSTVKIDSGTYVKLDAAAASYVLLDTGFTAKYGSVFIAQALNGCNAGSPQLPNEIVNSLQNNTEAQVIVYPNPTTGKVTIEHPATLSELNLFDLAGKRVMHINLSGNTQTDIDVGHLADGIYILHAQGYSNIKIIKQ